MNFNQTNINQLFRIRNLALALLLGTTCVAADKPNFVIIFTDDQGYADLGCFGGDHVKTPRIDQMAAEGGKLTSFYVAGSLCTPSRAALMTASYPKRVGLAAGVNLAGDKKGLNPSEVTIAELLKTAGYATGIFGKWHLGDQPEFFPTRQGFSEFFGLPYSHDIHPFHPDDKKYQFPPLPLMEGEKVIEEDPDADYLTKRITERAVDFIAKHKDGAFFLYVPHPIPHRPIHMSPPFMEEVPGAIKAQLEKEKEVNYLVRDKIYNEAIGEIDWSVGEILDALKKNGLDEKTVVIFTSDNGPAVGKATPLAGGKASPMEGGMRVPAVIRWPGIIPPGQVNDELMTTMDLLPTFVKLAGAELPSDRVIDGKDIFPVLSEGAKSPHEAFFYYQGNTLKAVRSGKWKLHLGNIGRSDHARPGKNSGLPNTALFDLEADMGERNNVLKEHPEIANELRAHGIAFEVELDKNSRPAGLVANPKPLTIKGAAKAE
ncbi:MAG: sulfatase [Akkermansiaceae bacterium]